MKNLNKFNINKNAIGEVRKVIAEFGPDFKQAGCLLFWREGPAFVQTTSDITPLKRVKTPEAILLHRSTVCKASARLFPILDEVFDMLTVRHLDVAKWDKQIQAHDYDKQRAVTVINEFCVRALYDEAFSGPCVGVDASVPAPVDRSVGALMTHDLTKNHHLANWVANFYVPVLGFLEHLVDAYALDGCPEDIVSWGEHHREWIESSLATRDDLGQWLATSVIHAHLPGVLRRLNGMMMAFNHAATKCL